MSKTSEQYGVLIISIVRTLADRYGFDELEALRIANQEIKKENLKLKLEK